MAMNTQDPAARTTSGVSLNDLFLRFPVKGEEYFLLLVVLPQIDQRILLGEPH